MFRLNNQGNVVISLVILAMVSIMVITNFSFFPSIWKSVKTVETSTIMNTLMDSAVGAIENEDAWNRTTGLNGNMSCLRTNNANCPSADNHFLIYNADGSFNMSGDPADGNGFNKFGSSCTTFSETNPDANCPYKFEITWNPVANAAGSSTTLIDPLTNNQLSPWVNIKIVLRYYEPAATQKVFKADLINKTFIRGQAQTNLAAACHNSGGSYDSTTKKCMIQYSSCASGYSLAGFYSNGQPMCVESPFHRSGNCGSGFAATGVTAGGGIECGKF